MTRRLVVHIRYSPSLDPDESAEERSDGWGKLAVPLVERAIALGGRIVSFAPERLSADFAWDGLYDALDFVVEAPEAPELSMGIAFGPVKALQGSSRIVLGVGEAIAAAARLAELARPGEVLVLPDLVAATNGAIGTIGEAGRRPGRPNIEALILDPEAPLRDVPKVLAMSLEEIPSSAPESTPPASLRSAAILELASEGQLGVGSIGDAISEALGRRDTRSLAELAARLHSQGESEASERIDAILALTKGKSGDALRTLRAAKDASGEGAATGRARACLAYGVALSAVGRYQEATLEGLEGLARARQTGDARGVIAACRLLAHLSEKLGDPVSREIWLSKSA